MFMGVVQSVTTRDGSQQVIRLLDSDQDIIYNNDTWATVLRDGVVLNVSVSRICDGDKLLSVIPMAEFIEPRLF